MTETQISGDLLTIDGVVIPAIKSYSVEYAHLWTSAERNLSGSVRADFIGLFPKIKATTRDVLDRSELKKIYQVFENQHFFTVTFWDPGTDSFKTGKFYPADWSIDIFSKKRGLYNGTEITIVPVDKR